MPAKLTLIDVRLRYPRPSIVDSDNDSALAVDLAGNEGAPSIQILPGQFTILLGPSGCGKSSLLRMIAGIIRPTEGEILKDGIAITGPGRDRGLVFQAYTCFPWLTVKENVMFGRDLAASGEHATSIDNFTRRAQEITELVGLGDALRKYPRELSGGMMQRVAIARALVTQPDVLLMDEPFGALDPHIRVKMQELMLTVERTLSTTIVFVTHDAREAVYLGDVIYISTLRPCFLKYRLVHPFKKAELPRDEARMKYSLDFLRFQREVEDRLNYLIENPDVPRSAEKADATALKRSRIGILEELSDTMES